VVTAVGGPAAAILAAIAGGGAGGPGGPGIGREAAQRLARAELSKPEYHQHLPLLQRITRAILIFIVRVFHAASGAAPGGWWGLVALAALAVIVVAGLLSWVGPVARARRGSGPLAAAGGARTARHHRQDAERLATAGDYDAAMIECVRAIAAELEERGVVPPRTGRTADEFAAEAGQALPAHADALREAARMFDDIRYGQHPGSRAGYEQVSQLDRRIRASAPKVSRSGGSAGDGTAGPATADAAPVTAGGRAS
jgi:Domain of unknown function (DUF4129)